jgi:hypothetical protein
VNSDKYELQPLTPEEQAGFTELASSFESEVKTRLLGQLKVAWFLAMEFQNDPRLSSSTRAWMSKLIGQARTVAQVVLALDSGKLALCPLSTGIESSAGRGATIALVSPEIAPKAVGWIQIPFMLILRIGISAAVAYGLIKVADVISETFKIKAETEAKQIEMQGELAQLLPRLPADEARALADRIQDTISKGIQADNEDWLVRAAGTAGKAVGTGLRSTAGEAWPLLLLLFLFAQSRKRL